MPAGAEQARSLSRTPAGSQQSVFLKVQQQRLGERGAKGAGGQRAALPRYGLPCVYKNSTF